MRIFIHKQNEIESEENVICARFMLAINQPETEQEGYTARFIVHGHKYRGKDLIRHSQRAVQNRNIIMSSIAVMFPEHKICRQKFTHAYIQEHDLQLGVYIRPFDHFNLSQDKYLKLSQSIIRIIIFRRLMVPQVQRILQKLIKTSNNRRILIVSL